MIVSAAIAMTAFSLLLVAAWGVFGCRPCEAAYTILLQGTVAQNCNVEVTPLPGASNLPLTAIGAQRVQVGTVLQNCNKKAGYDLIVESQNCSVAPAGGKLIEPGSGEHVSYSAEFANPTTGGSQASVTNLLSVACVAQIARSVNESKINNEISYVFVNFNPSLQLAAGVYQDVITITMNVK